MGLYTPGPRAPVYKSRPLGRLQVRSADAAVALAPGLLPASALPELPRLPAAGDAAAEPVPGWHDLNGRTLVKKKSSVG